MTCADTADCWDFRPVDDPGNNSQSGNPEIRWEQCRTCGEFFPIYVDTGRFASVVFY
jgi:hypothetical protein